MYVYVCVTLKYILNVLRCILTSYLIQQSCTVFLSKIGNYRMAENVEMNISLIVTGKFVNSEQKIIVFSFFLAILYYYNALCVTVEERGQSKLGSHKYLYVIFSILEAKEYSSTITFFSSSSSFLPNVRHCFVL